MNTMETITNKNNSPSLAGCIIYASEKPCSMCAAACIWAGVNEIVIGASIQNFN